MDTNLLIGAIIFIILVTFQYTLSQILIELRDIKTILLRLLKEGSFDD